MKKNFIKRSIIFTFITLMSLVFLGQDVMAKPSFSGHSAKTLPSSSQVKQRTTQQAKTNVTQQAKQAKTKAAQQTKQAAQAKQKQLKQNVHNRVKR
jgi:hypothetical protein